MPSSGLVAAAGPGPKSPRPARRRPWQSLACCVVLVVLLCFLFLFVAIAILYSCFPIKNRCKSDLALGTMVVVFFRVLGFSLLAGAGRKESESTQGPLI